MLASIVCNLRDTAVIAGLNMALMLVVAPLVISDLTVTTAFGAVGVPLFTYLLILIGVRHRTRLERIRQDELRQHRDHLEEMVQERTTDLTTANQRLNQLARAKDEFVSNVSHELRTPITNIKLHHSLLQQRPDDHARYLSILEHETERLENLIESLLLLSRFDQQRVTVTFAP
ncbi:MAG: HAMP domain-containing histidine kinase, partial [Chloroflexi bacterium]|nr:HAMP domain-containing histidine kinase [Chloroflexota bacterium]